MKPTDFSKIEVEYAELEMLTQQSTAIALRLDEIQKRNSLNNVSLVKKIDPEIEEIKNKLIGFGTALVAAFFVFGFNLPEWLGGAIILISPIVVLLAYSKYQKKSTS